MMVSTSLVRERERERGVTEEKRRGRENEIMMDFDFMMRWRRVLEWSWEEELG